MVESIRSNLSTNLRQLWQAIGTWEENANALDRLGVCYYHFLFDQNQLHTRGLKQTCSVDKSIVHFHICLFCNKKKSFFSHGNSCTEHS